MLFVGWIFNAPFGRCYLLGGFYASLMLIGARSAPYGYVIGGVDFLCIVRLMLFVGWILCGGNVVRSAPYYLRLKPYLFMLKSALLRDKQIN
jgi:hypothetical protein